MEVPPEQHFQVDHHLPMIHDPPDGKFSIVSCMFTRGSVILKHKADVVPVYRLYIWCCLIQMRYWMVLAIYHLVVTTIAMENPPIFNG